MTQQTPTLNGTHPEGSTETPSDRADQSIPRGTPSTRAQSTGSVDTPSTRAELTPLPEALDGLDEGELMVALAMRRLTRATAERDQIEARLEEIKTAHPVLVTAHRASNDAIDTFDAAKAKERAALVDARTAAKKARDAIEAEKTELTARLKDVTTVIEKSRGIPMVESGERSIRTQPTGGE